LKVADDALKASVSAAKGAGVADDALKALGIGDDILKASKVGLPVVEAVTAGIPGVGEIVGAVGDAIQIGVAVGTYAKIGVYNKNLAKAVDAAQQPVTITDLASMANGPNGQAQLLTYLNAMAATNGQPPPVDKPTMTLKQIIAVSQSF
jgi:hypothetical protein